MMIKSQDKMKFTVNHRSYLSHWSTNLRSSLCHGHIWSDLSWITYKRLLINLMAILVCIWWFNSLIWLYCLGQECTCSCSRPWFFYAPFSKSHWACGVIFHTSYDFCRGRLKRHWHKVIVSSRQRTTWRPTEYDDIHALKAIEWLVSCYFGIIINVISWRYICSKLMEYSITV